MTTTLDHLARSQTNARDIADEPTDTNPPPHREAHLAAPHATSTHTPNDPAHPIGTERPTDYRALARAGDRGAAPPSGADEPWWASAV